MISHLKKRLSNQVNQLLGKQVTAEHHASLQYLEMANWATQKGYESSAQFLYKQSEEERQHMLKLTQYVHDMGGSLEAENRVHVPKKTFASLRELFIAALEAEVNTSRLISAMVDCCLQEKDFMTFGFLQWFILEQIEEEAVARRHIDLFEVIDDCGGVAMYMVDQAIGQGK